MASTWSDENTEILKIRWAQGASAGVIGKELGLSRQSITSKVDRLGLPTRETVIRVQYPRKAIAPRPAFELPPQAVTADDIPLSQRKQLLDLEDHHCRFPYGDVGTSEFFFCGGDAVSGMPYCHAHCRVAYNPRNSRQAAALNKKLKANEAPSLVPEAA